MPAKTRKIIPVKPRRANTGARPQITFTSDFHELVTGDLVPGPCTLSFDPLRLVKPEEAVGHTHQVRASVRFHPQKTEWHGVMELPAGMPVAQMANPMGQGLMLITNFQIPEGCDELEVWFSCTHEDGTTHYDSDFGQNYWLRFGLADLKIQTAKVVATDAKIAQDTFEFECITPLKVDSVSLRWRVTSIPNSPREITALVVKSATEAKTWSAPGGGIPVPKGSVVAYDVVYSVEGRTFTDDNQGCWYVAD